jgi:hypothetical protein
MLRTLKTYSKGAPFYIASDYRPYEVASHFSGKRVISNDADRFKGFYSYFFLRTNIPFPRRTNRVSVAALFHVCHPN